MAKDLRGLVGKVLKEPQGLPAGKNGNEYIQLVKAVSQIGEDQLWEARLLNNLGDTTDVIMVKWDKWYVKTKSLQKHRCYCLHGASQRTVEGWSIREMTRPTASQYALSIWSHSDEEERPENLWVLDLFAGFGGWETADRLYSRHRPDRIVCRNRQ